MITANEARILSHRRKFDLEADPPFGNISSYEQDLIFQYKILEAEIHMRRQAYYGFTNHVLWLTHDISPATQERICAYFRMQGFIVQMRKDSEKEVCKIVIDWEPQSTVQWKAAKAGFLPDK